MDGPGILDDRIVVATAAGRRERYEEKCECGAPHASVLLRAVLRVLLALMLAVAFLAAGCGDDEGGGGSGGSAAERGFLQAMVPHHESAVEMAKVAVERGESPEIKQLATAIRDAQQPEIDRMRKIHQRMFGSALVPDEAGHEALGLSSEEAGMGHGEAAQMLEGAKEFDRAFIDEMVPHHRGAVRMAQAVLAETDDAELKKLAQEIVDAQNREIDEMNAFRTQHYGGPVPDDGASGGYGGGGGGGGEEHDGGH